ncbi:hypothetical protein FQN57_004358 [Myotisia sp. PD_48]|nr:hypothetical protein FQN57_004358 [Myotisia sp. PD_48]
MSQTSWSQHLKPKLILRVALVLIALVWLFHLFSSYPRNFQHDVDTPRSLPQSQRKIGKVTMLFGERKQTFEKALVTHQEHSHRLGYPLFILREPLIDGVWNKPAFMIRLLLQELERPLDQRLEWLFWFDADSVLMNPNMPLETFLPPTDLTHVHLLISKDWNGLNYGAFFLRVHPWSVDLLSANIAYRTMRPGVDLFWHEQSALVNILKENSKMAESVVYCPLRWFNAYARSADGKSLNPHSPTKFQVHPGDLLVHFPGTAPDKLDSTLGPYLAIAQSHQAEWELPLENTGYIEQTTLFWKDKKPQPGPVRKNNTDIKLN